MVYLQNVYTHKYTAMYVYVVYSQCTSYMRWPHCGIPEKQKKTTKKLYSLCCHEIGGMNKSI